MKLNENGDFCVLYVEPTDEKSALIQTISERNKPVVILLAEQARVFQSPEDFSELKQATQQLDIPIIFILANNGDLAELAARNGFPVYASVEMLIEAVASGQLSRHRSWIHMITTLEAEQPALAAKTKKAASLLEAEQPALAAQAKKAASLLEAEQLAVVAEAKKAASLLQAEQLAVAAQAKKTASLLEAEQPALAAQAKKTTSLLEAERPVVAAEAKKTTSLLETERPVIAAKAKKTIFLPTIDDEIAQATTLPLYPIPPSVNVQPTLSESLLAPSGELPFGDLPSAMELPHKRQRQPSHFLKTFAVLAIIALTLVSVGTLLISYHPLPVTSAVSGAATGVVGRVAFVSSEQISENSNQGLNDEVLVDLHGVPNPPRQKSYYGWLLGDKNQDDMKTIFLGNLPVDHGNARLLYPGDQQHTNLLAFSSRLLVTEEDATIAPVGPSPDYTTWRYYGEISQASINTSGTVNNLSFLTHLRHLLASDPTLDEMGLRGGLNTWLYRNTSQIVEWMSSVRQPWEEKKDVGFVRRQTIRTLTYLDGISFAAQDLSANTSLINNERLARIGLLEVNGPNQDPPGYLTHLVHHLNGLLQASGATPDMRKTIAGIVVALNDIQFWLTRLRQDALTLIKMNDDQLGQPATLALINDMISNARNAFVGQVDPVNGQMRQGVNWIHTQMQQLATLNVAPFVADQQSIQWVKDTKRTTTQFNLVRGSYE